MRGFGETHHMKEIVENAFVAFCEMFQYLTCMVLQYLARASINSTFTPSLDTFITGTDGYGGLMDQAMFDNIQTAFQYVALSLCGLFFLIHLIFFGLAAGTEMKDTIGQLVFRFIVSLAMSVGITFFLNTFMTFGTNIFEEAFNDPNNSVIESLTLDGGGFTDETGRNMGATAASIMSATNPDNIENALEDATLEDVASNFIDFNAVVLIFKILLQIVFFCIVIYNFAKLVIEMVKRYITMCVLYMTSKLAAPFYTSALTENVFFSYIKLFGVTVGILLFTKLWILVSLHTMATINCNFTNMCIMIAIIQIGVKIEALTKELGLTTANLGGALLDSVAATGAAVSMIVSKSTNKTGETLINLGGATGNLGIASLGSALSGKPMSFESRMRTMNDSLGAQMRTAATKNSPVSNLTGSQKKVIDEAIGKTGLFRNMSLQNVLGDLNSAGYKEAMGHIVNSEFGSFKDMLNGRNSTITPTSYSQNAGLGFEYQSSNGIKRTGFISDAPKKGKGITSIPIQMENGKMAYANFDPMSMDSLHRGDTDTIYNSSGETFGNGLTTMEMDTGLELGHFVTNGDTNATHYAAALNNSGGIDILYNKDGISPVNLDKSNIIGAVTKDGHNLKTSTYSWGNNGEKTPEKDIFDTLTRGSWSNRGFQDVKEQDIRYNADTKTIQFSATDAMTGKRSGYTAMPSVSIQGKVTGTNTITDPVHGSYTFCQKK